MTSMQLDITPDNILFNFSPSRLGGGYKRLYQYAKFLDQVGGATFFIHPTCAALRDEFPHNRYVVIEQSIFARMFNDCSFLHSFMDGKPQPDFYYSYGIPIYHRLARINWFHLSNVLPLALRGIPLDFYTRIKLGLLGQRIKADLDNADVVSAESLYSLDVIGSDHAGELFLSVNGNDDEIEFFSRAVDLPKLSIATVVGTYIYKALDDTLRVYDFLKRSEPDLRLRVIGPEKTVPSSLRNHTGVDLVGLQVPTDVITSLRQSRFYISTTHIENSYNAAAEGIYLADEAYISDIEPHRELLAGQSYQTVNIAGIDRPMLHVRRDDLTSNVLKSWAQVAEDMMCKATSRLNQL